MRCSVRYPTGHTGPAADAPYEITQNGGTTARAVDQTTNGGQWVSLGTWAFTKHGDHAITLGVSATGVVAADAVLLVRDASAETDTEAKDSHPFAHIPLP